jgi:hypothetical protein
VRGCSQLHAAWVTKRSKRPGSCPGHSSGLRGERIWKSAVNQSQTGAIPHWLAGSITYVTGLAGCYEAGMATNGGTVGWMVPPGGSRVMPNVSPLSTPEMSIGPLRPLCTASVPSDRILWPGAPISHSW